MQRSASTAHRQLAQTDANGTLSSESKWQTSGRVTPRPVRPAIVGDSGDRPAVLRACSNSVASSESSSCQFGDNHDSIRYSAASCTSHICFTVCLRCSSWFVLHGAPQSGVCIESVQTTSDQAIASAEMTA